MKNHVRDFRRNIKNNIIYIAEKRNVPMIYLDKREAYNHWGKGFHYQMKEYRNPLFDSLQIIPDQFLIDNK